MNPSSFGPVTGLSPVRAIRAFMVAVLSDETKIDEPAFEEVDSIIGQPEDVTGLLNSHEDLIKLCHKLNLAIGYDKEGLLTIMIEQTEG